MILLEEYIVYLSKKHKSKKINDERTLIVSQLQDFLVEKNLTGTTDDIEEFFKTKHWSAMETGRTYECMEEYVSFVKKESSEPAAVALAQTIHDYMLFTHEQHLKDLAKKCSEDIILIPEGVKFAPKYLKGLNDKQMCAAFYKLQLLMKNIYEDIYQNPYDWGFPDCATRHFPAFVRGMFLYTFALDGIYEDGVLTIDTKKILSDKDSKPKRLKSYNNSVKHFDGFKKMGLIVEGFDLNTESFRLTYPENPHVITALHVYGLSMKDTVIHTWGGGFGKDSACFSYRYIEDPETQEYEAAFHHITDYYPEELLKIQKWLYAEAAKCGYKFNPKSPLGKTTLSIGYGKGSKSFLSVGYKNGVITSKVIFRNVFESNIEKVEQLALKFPDTFVSNCWDCNPGCKFSWRINYELFGKKHRNCAQLSFWFKGVTIDNVDSILELFKIENKIN